MYKPIYSAAADRNARALNGSAVLSRSEQSRGEGRAQQVRA